MRRLNTIAHIVVAAATTSAASATTSAPVDVLAIVQEIDPDVIPLAVEDDRELRSYFAARLGYNLLGGYNPTALSFKIADRGAIGVRALAGTSQGLSLSVDGGVDLNFGLGLKLTDEVTIEIQGGIAYNKIERVQGDLLIEYGTIDADGDPVFDPSENRSYALSGGNGAYYQVPITANLLFDKEIDPDLRFRAGVGVGVQWTHLQMSGIQAVGNAGVEIPNPDGGPPPTVLVPYAFSVDAPSIAVRYQAMIGLDYRLGANAFLGGYVRYGGTSQNNFGSLKFDGDLNNTLRDAADVEVAGLQNFGFGLTLTIAF